jgi:pseudaminic acid biosynthesis-associated methylase
MSKELNEQQNFWANDYALNYIEKNKNFNQELGVEGWSKMLHKAENVTSVLECGCNIGRNIGFLNSVLPNAQKSIIEISEPAYNFVTSQYQIQKSFNGAILNSNFEPHSFDLTFTIGVLIHISPNDLLQNMTKLFEYSNRYILIGEYFNRTPVMIEYQGQKNKLFKQDFGKLFIENFNVKLVDYGFLWGHIYDNAGFDDVTWWLFEKK